MKKLYELALYPIQTVQEPELFKLSTAWLVKPMLIESTLGLQGDFFLLFIFNPYPYVSGHFSTITPLHLAVILSGYPRSFLLIVPQFCPLRKMTPALKSQKHKLLWWHFCYTSLVLASYQTMSWSIYQATKSGFSKRKQLQPFSKLCTLDNWRYNIVWIGLIRAKLHPSSELRCYCRLVNIIKHD